MRGRVAGGQKSADGGSFFGNSHGLIKPTDLCQTHGEIVECPGEVVFESCEAGGGQPPVDSDRFFSSGQGEGKGLGFVTWPHTRCYC